MLQISQTGAIYIPAKIHARAHTTKCLVIWLMMFTTPRQHCQVS